MPQLSPAPWFFILLSSWLIFASLTPNKILGYTDLNNFNQLNKTHSPCTWLWPW